LRSWDWRGCDGRWHVLNAWIKWQLWVSSNQHKNTHCPIITAVTHWDGSKVYLMILLFEEWQQWLEWRQWSGGKLLHGIIARILLCCVGVTDGMTDITVIQVRSVTSKECAWSPFSLTSKTPHCACSPGEHAQSIQMRGQFVR
jgi:hypothetical protein